MKGILYHSFRTQLVFPTSETPYILVSGILVWRSLEEIGSLHEDPMQPFEELCKQQRSPSEGARSPER